MANLFFNLPLPVLNGPGAAVNVSAQGTPKSFVVAGDFPGATITIEASVDGGIVFAPVVIFQNGEMQKVVDVVAEFLRVNVSGRKASVPFAANIDVGANDNGAQFFTLPLPALNGPGAAVNTSALGSFNTFIAGGVFEGARILVEVSEDGIDWAPLVQFSGQGGLRSKVVTSDFLRTNVSGRKATVPFTGSLAVGAANDAGVSTVIIVEDEGVPLPGAPHNTLNFIGAGVLATDAGGGVADITIPGSGGLDHTALVDPVNGNDATGAFGTFSTAFATIQAALDAIPTPAIGDGAASRQVWTIIISPDDYDEDLAVDLTRKRIILASAGPWGLGTFGSVDWAPSGVRRNITITTTDAVINDGIRNGFSIQPMLPAGEGLTTHQAYLTRPRISGKIDVSGVGNSIELTLSCEVFGTTGGAAGDSIVGGTTIIQSYFYHSRFRGKLTGSNWNFQVNERTRFGGLVTVSAYSTILSCRFDVGMTVTSAVNAGILPDGFVLCDFAGTFTGPAGSLRLDGSTNYWFVTNGAVLAGGATKIIEDIPGETIRDEGVAIPGTPHWVLNFIGVGVTATDAGAGVANITVSGGAWNVTGPFTSVGAPHALAIDDLAQANVTLGTFAFTLPAIAAANKGRQVAFKKIAGGATIVTLTPAGADTIEGFAGGFPVLGALVSVTLVSDGVSNWMVI